MDISNYVLLYTSGNLYWKDLKGYYLGCNLEFSKIARLKSPQEIIGKSDIDLFSGILTEELIKKLSALDQYVIKNDIEQICEEIGVDLLGNKTCYLTKKTPLKDVDGNIIGIIGNSLDISELKQKEKELLKEKEKAEIASRIKTEFLENMRHDIRTPLSGIIGYAELLENEAINPKQKEYASSLAASGYALTDLLNGILEVINVSSGEIPLLKKKFNLQKKLNEVISLNLARALHKKINLSLEYDPSLPSYLIGDSVRIYRIILELVTNALNFTHKGHVKLSAKLAKENEKDVVIKIIVDDTGIGIPAEKQQDIYLQFKRLTPSYEGIYKGYGLGLSIVKQLIEDVHGEIYVESQKDCGTQFTFIIKLKKSLLDEPQGSDDLIPSFKNNTFNPPTKFNELTKHSVKFKADTYKSQILVVEDNNIAAQVVIAILNNMGCEVDLAKKGYEAIELVKQNQYDLIFMDIGLPDINGYEVTKKIRLNELKKPRIPIIALTAHDSEENKKHCIDIGINAILTKPLIHEKAQYILDSFIPARKNELNTKEQLALLANNSK